MISLILLLVCGTPMHGVAGYDNDEDEVPTVIEMQMLKGKWVVDAYFETLLLHKSVPNIPWAIVAGKLDDDELQQEVVQFVREHFVFRNTAMAPVRFGRGAAKLNENRSRVRLIVDDFIDNLRPFEVKILPFNRNKKHEYLFRYKDFGKLIEKKLTRDNHYQAILDLMRTR